MKKEIYWAPNISVSVVGNELFIFDEITNEVYYYKGIKKECFMAIENNHDINGVLKRITDDCKKEDKEIVDSLEKFLEKCLKRGLLVM